MKVAGAARRHGARRRVGRRGGTGTVRRRRSVINRAWLDGRDGGRRAVEEGGDTGVGGRRRGLGSASLVRMAKGGAGVRVRG
ncbi:hypothetical protein U1Q18_032418 [Sarracenia purpurea var. burkii]